MTADEAEVYVYALAERGLPRTVRVRSDARCVSFPWERWTRSSSAATRPSIPRPRRSSSSTPSSSGSRHARRRCCRRASDRVTTESALRSQRLGTGAGDSRSLARVRGRRQMTIRVFGEARCRRMQGADAVQSGTEFLRSRQARAHYLPAEVAAIFATGCGLCRGASGSQSGRARAPRRPSFTSSPRRTWTPTEPAPHPYGSTPAGDGLGTVAGVRVRAGAV